MDTSKETLDKIDEKQTHHGVIETNVVGDFYRAVCSCGWLGNKQPSSAFEAAAAELKAHQRKEALDKIDEKDAHSGSIENELTSDVYRALCSCGWRTSADSQEAAEQALDAHYKNPQAPWVK